MNFVAIDFETANAKRTSACSVGIAIVEDDKIVKTKSYYIKPEPFEFNPYNVIINGIAEDDVINAPNFDTVWESIKPFCYNKTLVAHNAAFDMSVLRYSLDFYDLPYPRTDYICTLQLAKALLPNLGCYRLNFLCARYGIAFKHHDACEDAVACAELLIKLCDEFKINSQEEFVSKEILRPGEIYGNSYRPCRLLSKKKPTNSLNYIPIVENISDEFENSNFVFTGTLLSMPRNYAEQIVMALGGYVQKSVSKTTNFLVSGYQDPIRLKGNPTSRKTQKALDLAAKGQDIQVIEEDDFLNMLPLSLLEDFMIGV